MVIKSESSKNHIFFLLIIFQINLFFYRPTSMLPLLQQPFEITNPTGGGGSTTDNLMADGPTVRQHLQQQQVARRQKQQHEAMVRRLCQQQPRQEETIAWGGGEGQPIVDKPQMSPRKRSSITYFFGIFALLFQFLGLFLFP